MRLIYCLVNDVEIRLESAARDWNDFETLLGKLDLDNNNLILKNAGFQGDFEVYNVKANVHLSERNG